MVNEKEAESTIVDKSGKRGKITCTAFVNKEEKDIIYEDQDILKLFLKTKYNINKNLLSVDENESYVVITCEVKEHEEYLKLKTKKLSDSKKAIEEHEKKIKQESEIGEVIEQ